MPTVGYVLPLIFVVLERDGVEESEEQHGEQVLLALEVLSSHMTLRMFGLSPVVTGNPNMLKILQFPMLGSRDFKCCRNCYSRCRNIRSITS